MSYITNLLVDFSQWLTPWIADISTALVVSTLVIWGDRIHKAIKSVVAGSNFIIRTVVFIALCAFGYGFATAFISPWLARGFLYIPQLWMGLVVVLAFVAVGWMAEKHNYS